ncbi:MAG: glycosyltransferase family 4 protein [Desulfobacterales bacterium]
MKILFVSDQLPYPPRNGVTIPTFNYMSRLALHHDVSLLFLTEDIQKIDRKQVTANRNYVNQLWILERWKKSKLIRMRDELIMRKPYFLGYTYNTAKLKEFLLGQAFDVIWISPFKTVDIIETIFGVIGSTPIYVAGINDCATAMLRNMGKKLVMSGLDFKTRVLYLTRWIRSWPIGRMETKMLRKYDLILVQTDVERLWLDILSNGELNVRTMILPNGVNELLFKIPIGYVNKDLLLLGNLESEYREVISWVVQKVWPRIKSAKHEARFFIIGKKDGSTLCRTIDSDSRIVHKEYEEDIRKVFRQKAVMLAPVFKAYGLINKVIESMAAGVPVVGDSGSFNGIPGFENGRHGIIAKDAKVMADSVIALLDSHQKSTEMARAARNLVKKHFSWQDRINMINERLDTFLKKRRVAKI